ncbi:hypothetical protein HanXRQr2_Chr13g0603201 [Helianthus annuus]|uniref:Uncharacterized protein n=1 Tax=Helianthus annuus TaxID=4232 RepID=A0A9K3HBL8_HELAN|nr:hypothetical protein HanXRQr2_Chr13g0603201 [Helianthus annuus]KAJ0850471.1 hypothetical protein HanPSC8_Chr13g0581221 [Helianthus annuus]
MKHQRFKALSPSNSGAHRAGYPPVLRGRVALPWASGFTFFFCSTRLVVAGCLLLK